MSNQCDEGLLNSQSLTDFVYIQPALGKVSKNIVGIIGWLKKVDTYLGFFYN